jgi:hypothetical protein
LGKRWKSLLLARLFSRENTDNLVNSKVFQELALCSQTRRAIDYFETFSIFHRLLAALGFHTLRPRSPR